TAVIPAPAATLPAAVRLPTRSGSVGCASPTTNAPWGGWNVTITRCPTGRWKPVMFSVIVAVRSPSTTTPTCWVPASYVWTVPGRSSPEVGGGGAVAYAWINDLMIA